MRNPLLLKAILVSGLFLFAGITQGQVKESPKPVSKTSGSVKPFKVLTNGKQITIQAKQNLKSIMVWTANGHRFIEQKDLSTNSYTFTVPSKENVFYIMIETVEGKRFTEKMGVK